MGRRQVGKSKAEVLGRAHFGVWLCQAYAKVVERIEPEPRAVGKPRKEAAWLLSSAQVPFLGEAWHRLWKCLATGEGGVRWKMF